MDDLAKARRRLAAVIAEGRPRKIRVAVHCRNGVTRYVTEWDRSPDKDRLLELQDQAQELGVEIARLERLRGPLKPRIVPKVAQVKPSLRPDRIAHTPRTGKWGYGLTPTYQGRRTAPAELPEDAAWWSRTTQEEITEPCLKEEAREEHKTRFPGWFAPKGKRGKGKPRRATRHEMLEWGEEQRAIQIAKEQKDGD